MIVTTPGSRAEDQDAADEGFARSAARRKGHRLYLGSHDLALLKRALILYGHGLDATAKANIIHVDEGEWDPLQFEQERALGLLDKLRSL